MPTFFATTQRDVSTATLRDNFGRLRRDEGKRHREIATILAVSEAELIDAHAGADLREGDHRLRATRLQPLWPDIIGAVETLGEVMALTRNHACVHEKTGVYRNASDAGPVGLVRGGAIDLRLFYQQWAHGFAVHEDTEDGAQRSLQFFSASGEAVHKLFLQERSEQAAYDAVVKRFAASIQELGVEAMPAATMTQERPDAEVDVAGFRDAWAALRDTHEFLGLLRRFAVTRTQALRLADPKFAQPVEEDCVFDVLDVAARAELPIMVFVGNAGAIQIHSGPVRRITVVGPWLNVLDSDFNLHLREDAIASAWVVSKPTTDGLVTSLELYDHYGETIALFFGERKPGVPERCEWRLLIENLLAESGQPRQ